MPRKKRPFYIIGHNPNTIKEAKEYLDKGANALEPDIVHAEGRFYVCHHPHISYQNIPTVETYLQDLKSLLTDRRYDLALIVWDMKDTDFDINLFIGIVKENFSGGCCDGVAMLFTHSDDISFLTGYKNNDAYIGVGLDESNMDITEMVHAYTNAGITKYSYADGIITIINKPGVYKNVNAAVQHRQLNEPDSFKIIYTWVLSLKKSMCKYLDSYVDGIMVDTGAVSRLKKLLESQPYSDVYEMAKNGYNPFMAKLVPKYLLTVKTADVLLAGTDARIIFSLRGKTGEALSCLPFHGSRTEALERGSITYIALEGMDIGEIKSLHIKSLSTGLTSDWLPEYITVESSLLEHPVHFIFNTEDKKEWISKKSGELVKFPGKE